MTLRAGIAFRLIFDFGLNQDCTDLVTMGYLSQRDLFNRHNALWGSYVFDVYVLQIGPLRGFRPAQSLTPDLAGSFAFTKAGQS
jgi:hypothetical protein